VGLSFDFEVLNLIGFSCYSVYAIGFTYFPSIEDAYMARHNGKSNKVDFQDLLFATHAAAITLVTIFQIWWYDGFRASRVSWPVGLLISVFIVTSFIYAMLVSERGGERPLTWIDWLYFVSYIKLTISTVKGLPQFYLNYKRKSTEGWNIHNILLDFTGGSLSLLQLLLDCNYTSDWSGISGNALKFGLSFVSIAFDILFCLQHFVFYQDPQRAFGYGLVNATEDIEGK
jgi:cystinosin